jgi:streptogramin lyase
VWFIDGSTTKAIGRITPAGAITEFSAGLSSMSQPNDLTLGPDGNLWFTDQGNTKAIGRVTPAGTITEYTAGLAMNSFPNDITAGADGNVWFTDDGSPAAIGRVTPAGAITEFTAGLQTGSEPDSLTAGPDGNVWFADQYAAQRAVGRITPAGTITEFTAGLTTGVPDDITAGLDGNLWVPQEADSPTPASVDRITPAGVITNFSAGLNSGGGGDGDTIVTGPDGNLWFNDLGTPKAIARVSLQIPPTAVTGATSGVTSSTATVAGSVNPLGSATTVTFQYGTSPALGSTAAGGSLAASGSPSAVSASLTGLPPSTVVYYRAVAGNVGGTTLGSVQTFTTAQAPPPPPLPLTLRSQKITAKFGNQQITLTTASTLACIAKSNALSVTLSSATIRNFHGLRLRFASAAFYLDRGVRHTRKETKHVRGGKKRKVTVIFTANAVRRHVPVTLSLRLRGLSSRTHTLKVTLSYRTSETEHGHKRTASVTKSLTAKFRVC